MKITMQKSGKVLSQVATQFIYIWFESLHYEYMTVVSVSIDAMAIEAQSQSSFGYPHYLVTEHYLVTRIFCDLSPNGTLIVRFAHYLVTNIHNL
jgi:hypothetical protein